MCVVVAVILSGRGGSCLDPRLVFSSIELLQDLKGRVVDNAAYGCLNGTWSHVLLRRYFRPLVSLCLDGRVGCSGSSASLVGWRVALYASTEFCLVIDLLLCVVPLGSCRAFTLRRVPCPLVEFASSSCASLTVRVVSSVLLDVSECAPGVARLAGHGGGASCCGHLDEVTVGLV